MKENMRKMKVRYKAGVQVLLRNVKLNASKKAIF